MGDLPHGALIGIINPLVAVSVPLAAGARDLVGQMIRSALPAVLHTSLAGRAPRADPRPLHLFGANMSHRVWSCLSSISSLLGLAWVALAPSSATAAECKFVMRKVDECVQSWSTSAGHSYVGLADLYYCEDMSQNPWYWYEWRTNVIGLNNTGDGTEYRSFYPKRHTGKVPANDTCTTIGQFLSIEAAKLAEKRISDYAAGWSGGDFLVQTVTPGLTRPCKRVVKEARTLVKMNVDTCISEWFNPKVDRTQPGFTSFANHATFWQARGDEASACLAGVERRCKELTDPAQTARYCSQKLTLAAAEPVGDTFAVSAWLDDAETTATCDAEAEFDAWYDLYADELLVAAYTDEELGIGGAWSTLAEEDLLLDVEATWAWDEGEPLTEVAFPLGATEEEWATLWFDSVWDEGDICEIEVSTLGEETEASGEMYLMDEAVETVVLETRAEWE